MLMSKSVALVISAIAIYAESSDTTTKASLISDLTESDLKHDVEILSRSDDPHSLGPITERHDHDVIETETSPNVRIYVIDLKETDDLSGIIPSLKKARNDKMIDKSAMRVDITNGAEPDTKGDSKLYNNPMKTFDFRDSKSRLDNKLNNHTKSHDNKKHTTNLPDDFEDLFISSDTRGSSDMESDKDLIHIKLERSSAKQDIDNKLESATDRNDAYTENTFAKVGLVSRSINETVSETALNRHYENTNLQATPKVNIFIFLLKEIRELLSSSATLEPPQKDCNTTIQNIPSLPPKYRKHDKGKSKIISYKFFNEKKIVKDPFGRSYYEAKLDDLLYNQDARLKEISERQTNIAHLQDFLYGEESQLSKYAQYRSLTKSKLDELLRLQDFQLQEASYIQDEIAELQKHLYKQDAQLLDPSYLQQEMDDLEVQLN